MLILKYVCISFWNSWVEYEHRILKQRDKQKRSNYFIEMGLHSVYGDGLAGSPDWIV